MTLRRLLLLLVGFHNTCLAQLPNADPLAQLRDIHLPAPVSAWPPAPGWWLLTLLVIVLIAVALRYALRQYRQRQQQRAYRQHALHCLQQLSTSSGGEFLTELNALLKRTALSAYPTLNISALHGQPWLDFLDQTHGVKLSAENSFSQGIGHILAGGQYQPEPPKIDTNALQQLAKQWIEKHLPAEKVIFKPANEEAKRLC